MTNQHHSNGYGNGNGIGHRLSARVRAGSEVAPWVREAIIDLEVRLDTAMQRLSDYEAAARYPGDGQRHCGASTASQLVHAQHKREDAEAHAQRLIDTLKQCKCIGVRDYATCSQRREPLARMCPRCRALAEARAEIARRDNK